MSIPQVVRAAGYDPTSPDYQSDALPIELHPQIDGRRPAVLAHRKSAGPVRPSATRTAARWWSISKKWSAGVGTAPGGDPAGIRTRIPTAA